jgi:endonuclease-3
MISRIGTITDWKSDPRFSRFVALFDRGRFFRAHEVLEELWLQVEGADRDFLQGIIQLAVSLEHMARNNPRGASKVLHRAAHRLERYGERHAGVAVGSLVEAIEAYVTSGGEGVLPRFPSVAAREPLAGRSGISRKSAPAEGSGTLPEKPPRSAKVGARAERTGRGVAEHERSAEDKGQRRSARGEKSARGKAAAGGKARASSGAILIDRKIRAIRKEATSRAVSKAGSGAVRAGRARKSRGAIDPEAAAKKRPFGLEPFEVRRERALAIVRGLRRLYPDARCELRHGDPLELLVATILSAQCTDVRVNMTTPALFSRYPDARSYAQAEEEELREMIRSTGFFRNKARSIIALGKTLVEKHGGQVPDTMDELVRLPGVGRKTANVILAEWFGQPGIAVDTHVIRLTGPVWRLTNEANPVKIEYALYELIPEKDRAFFGMATILHGRKVCSARNPNCGECSLTRICPSAFLFSSGRVRDEDGPRRRRRARPRRRGL